LHIPSEYFLGNLQVAVDLQMSGCFSANETFVQRSNGGCQLQSSFQLFKWFTSSNIC